MKAEDFWKPHCGAVSLTFDDGRESQLQKAIPAMDKRGIRGTFYLCPRGNDWRDSLRPWEQAARAGHEIGNHTLSHVCSDNFSGVRGGLEEMSLAQIEADILAAHERLATIVSHQKQWTFAYPCYQSFVGRGAGRQSYVPIVAQHFLCGRAGGEYGHANHPAVVDLACVWGLGVERMSGWEMIGLVEELTAPSPGRRADRRGQWVVLVFHEIDGHRLTVGSYDFGLLLDYLQRRSAEIWTAPVVEVAGRIADFRASLGRPSGEQA